MIIQKNFIDRSISPEMQELLNAKLKLVLMAVHERNMPLTISEYIHRINTVSSDSATYSNIIRLFNEMAEYYEALHNNHHARLKTDIEVFFEENFKESNFSISLTAAHFHLSESYFSKVFKDLIAILPTASAKFSAISSHGSESSVGVGAGYDELIKSFPILQV